MKLKEIADYLGGELYGDGAVEIIAPEVIERAGKGHITYLTSALKKSTSCIASAIIASKRLDIEMPQVIVPNPQAAFAALIALFYPLKHPFSGISHKADIAEDAELGRDVSIAPFVCIEKGASIGDNTVIYPNCYIGSKAIVGNDCVIYSNVVIREDCRIGNRVIIHPGAVVGADGFGFFSDRGANRKIPQAGNVIVEDDVEIGANSTIDRATLGSTVIGKGTKIDNLVQIGHNVQVGRNVIIVAQAGIGGSSRIGNNVILAGQAGISDHTEIETGTVIGAQSGVTGKLPKNIYVGTPGKPYKTVIKAYEMFHTLPNIKERLDKIEGFISIKEVSEYKKGGRRVRKKER